MHCTHTQDRVTVLSAPNLPPLLRRVMRICNTAACDPGEAQSKGRDGGGGLESPPPPPWRDGQHRQSLLTAPNGSPTDFPMALHRFVPARLYPPPPPPRKPLF